MINKIARSVAEAMADTKDGSTVLIGGFGTAGIPNELIDGLIACARSSAAFRGKPTARCSTVCTAPAS